MVFFIFIKYSWANIFHTRSLYTFYHGLYPASATLWNEGYVLIDQLKRYVQITHKTFYSSSWMG